MAERDQLQPAVIAWLFGVPQPESLEAAEQFLRTQVHPALYDTVAYVRSEFDRRGVPGIRRAAEQLGYDKVHAFYANADDLWASEAADFIEQYWQGHHEGDPHVYADLMTIASYFDEDLLHGLVASAMSLAARDQWESRWSQLGGVEPIPFVDFRKEWQSMARESLANQVDSIQPRVTVDMDPHFIEVYEGSNNAHYTIPRQLRLFDPLQRHHDMRIGEPRQVERYEVDTLLNLDWDVTESGITVRISIEGVDGHKASEDLFLSPRRLNIVRERGSAIPSIIGRFGDIPVHAEHFSAHPFGARAGVHKTLLPNEPVASLRVRQNSLEIKKLHPGVRLTVFA